MNVSLYSWALNALVAFFISYKVFQAYKGQPEGNLRRMYRDFSLAFFLAAFYFSLGVLIIYPYFTNVQVVVHSFLVIGTMFFFLAALDPPPAKRKFIIIAVLVISCILDFIAFQNLQPVIRQDFGNFYYIQSSRLPLLRTIDGILMFTFLLPSASFILIQSLRAKDSLTRVRLLLISIGLFSLVLASVLGYILGSTNSVWSNSIGSILAAPAFLVVLGGLMYGNREVREKAQNDMGMSA